jgi:hypothetical protein
MVGRNRSSEGGICEPGVIDFVASIYTSDSRSALNYNIPVLQYSNTPLLLWLISPSTIWAE